MARLLWQRLVHDKPRRFQMILGPRRVGKTTVLYQTVRHLLAEGIEPKRIWWLRVDHPYLISVELGRLARFVIDVTGADDATPAFLMVDEIAYASDWDLWLKTFHDERWPIRIAATSSATAALRQRRTESGVGRWEEQHLLPCSLAEALDLIGWDDPATPISDFSVADTFSDTIQSLPADHDADLGFDMFRRLFLLVGGFPELLVRPTGDPVIDLINAVIKSQRVLRDDAVDRAIYKDIPQSFKVNDPMMLEKLLYTLAGQMTGLLSPTNIAQRLGMSQPTVDRYLLHLQRVFLVFTLTNYSGGESARQRRGRKLYFTDSAVRNAALHRGIAPLDDPVEMGMLLENLVASSVNTLAAQAGVRLHHWRRGNTQEVDLVYDEPGQPLAFEIASSAGHSRKGLMALVNAHPEFWGHCYLVAPQAPVIHADTTETGIGMLPLDIFLLAVSAQSHRAMATRLGVPLGSAANHRANVTTRRSLLAASSSTTSVRQPGEPP